MKVFPVFMSRSGRPFRTADGHLRPVGHTMSEPTDFTHLDDPSFLHERARLRARLEQLPEDGRSRAELESLHDAMTDEFLRRARLAWSSTAAGLGRSVPKG
jgi:hypothetical protein